MRLALLISLVSCVSEARLKVAFIDTGVKTAYSNTLCENIDVTGEGTNDIIGHGTNILGLLSKGIAKEDVCFISIKYFRERDTPWENHAHFFAALDKALAIENLYMVNLSLAGESSNFFEKRKLGQLLNKGVKVVVSAGNDALDLDKSCDIFPACYIQELPKLLVIGSLSPYSNIGSMITTFRQGDNQCGFGVCLTGTSQATANYSNELLKDVLNYGKSSKRSK